VVTSWSKQHCPDCHKPLAYVPIRNSESLKELVCISCGTTEPTSPILEAVATDGSEFDGHGPDEAIIFDSNVGTAPGPERNRQVMTALNQDRRGHKEGLEFHVAKLDLLVLWGMSSDPTDRVVSEILTKTIKQVEKDRGVKISPARVDAIGRICKAGVRRGERVKRLTRREIQFAIRSIFELEGLL
jgi:hypothetical protein